LFQNCFLRTLLKVLEHIKELAMQRKEKVSGIDKSSKTIKLSKKSSRSKVPELFQ